MQGVAPMTGGMLHSRSEKLIQIGHPPIQCFLPASLTVTCLAA